MSLNLNMSQFAKLFAIVGSLLFLKTDYLVAQERPFHVIVHPSNPAAALTRQQLAKLFLKKATVWDNGTPAIPVDLKSSSAVRQFFSKLILDKSVQNVKMYWQQLIFSGKEVPPVEKSSDYDVVKFVENTPGSVGYISSETSPGKCKIIEIIL